MSELSGLTLKEFEEVGGENGLSDFKVVDTRDDASQVLHFKTLRFTSYVFFLSPADGRKPGEDKKFQRLQFFARFGENPNLEKVNEWNFQKNFVRCYKQERSIAFSLDMFVIGVSRNVFAEYIGIWRQALVDAEKYSWR